MTLASTLDPAAEKALRLPVGLSSPLWFMIGSAAMMGAAVFWATRWVKPGALGQTPASLPAPEPEVQAAMEKAVATAVATAEAATDLVIETIVEATEALTPDAGLEVVIDPVLGEPVVVAASEADEEPAAPADDLTVLSGIGPKLSASLAERGVTRFAQIAAWTEDEIAVLDKEMKLMGRIAREGWVEQAGKLAG